MPAARLTSLNFDTRVSAETAKQDKIGLCIHHGVINDTAEDVANFLRFLGGPLEDPRVNQPLPLGRIFNLPRRREPDFENQQIRRGVCRRGQAPIPLFGGHLEINQARGIATIWELESVLSLNPTRFLRHQEFSRRGLILENPSFNYCYYKTETHRRFEDEWSLRDDHDNWIPDQRFWHLYSSPRFWNSHVRSYLSGVVSELDASILSAAECQQVMILPPSVNPINLTSVETYWEFFVEDPIGAVLAMQQMLESFSSRLVRTRDYDCTVELEQPENSRCLKLETRIGETLKIYAKTNRRIRFEIVHQLQGDRSFRVPRGGHTFPTIVGVFPLLEHFATVAAQRINQVFAHFGRNASVPESQHTVLSFISDVQAACREPFSAYHILHLLVHNGSLVGGRTPLEEAFPNALRRLRREEILQKSGGRYSVTPRYTVALESMRNSGLGFLLGPTRRVRRTRP